MHDAVQSKMSVPVSNEEIKSLCKDAQGETNGFIFQQTMYRIKNPRATIPFYTGVLGMQLYLKMDFPNFKFTLYFLGYANPSDMPGELSNRERTAWALSQRSVLELTHNWGTEDDPEFRYHTGNTEPRGYGHIGVMVPDVEAACDRFQSLGVDFAKTPTGGKMKGLAYIKDPDGYWIEIFNNDDTASNVPV